MSSPSLASAVVLFDEAGQVLLVHQNYGRRRWSLPGGIVERDESPHAAAVREVEEETGLSVELQHLIGVYYLRRGKPGIGFMFLGRALNDRTPAPQTTEIDELGWFDPVSLPRPAVESLSVVLQDAIAGRRGHFAELNASPSWTAPP
jgi:8-oxo-dGTP pyrophosphatase MutT (NUDIX family)